MLRCEPRWRRASRGGGSAALGAAPSCMGAASSCGAGSPGTAATAAAVHRRSPAHERRTPNRASMRRKVCCPPARTRADQRLIYRRVVACMCPSLHRYHYQTASGRCCVRPWHRGSACQRSARARAARACRQRWLQLCTLTLLPPAVPPPPLAPRLTQCVAAWWRRADASRADASRAEAGRAALRLQWPALTPPRRGRQSHGRFRRG
jgi:hypothetical protein